MGAEQLQLYIPKYTTSNALKNQPTNSLMLLLSIDVGIKNLALCLVDTETAHIEQWDVSGVPPQHMDGIFVCMRDHLNDKPWVLTADLVLIEKQPDKNRGIVAVQHFLHAYFVINKIETLIYDARHKVPDVVGPGRAMYTKRKKVAIERVHEHLKTEEVNKDWLSIFEGSAKKDDLADTYLQAMSYVNRRVVAPPKKVKTSLLTPRRPTTHQKETKYSKSNLAWFMKDLGKDEFMKKKRLVKDMKRYFKGPDEILSNIK